MDARAEVTTIPNVAKYAAPANMDLSLKIKHTKTTRYIVR